MEIVRLDLFPDLWFLYSFHYESSLSLLFLLLLGSSQYKYILLVWYFNLTSLTLHITAPLSISAANSAFIRHLELLAHPKLAYAIRLYSTLRLPNSKETWPIYTLLPKISQPRFPPSTFDTKANSRITISRILHTLSPSEYHPNWSVPHLKFATNTNVN